MLLSTNVALVAGVLRAEDHASGQVMRAIAATRSLDAIVQDTLHALVSQARGAGHTWAEIGAVLHVSRQAAFQRFGGARSPGEADGAGDAGVPVPDAARHALPVLQAFLDGDFERARTRFNARMLEACSIALLTDAREQVRRYAGEVHELGTADVSVRDGYTVVDIPVALERADGVGRVVLDADAQVAGLFVRPKEAVS